MDKRKLYNSIMVQVAKEVKKALNESTPFIENKKRYIICDSQEEQTIQSIIDMYNDPEDLGDGLDHSDIVQVDVDQDIELSGMTGLLCGTIDFYVDVYEFENEDAPGHRWTDVEYKSRLDSYNLEFIDNETDLSYVVYLNMKDYNKQVKHNNIEDTEVKRIGDEHRKQEQDEENHKRLEEYRKKAKAFQFEVKSHPAKYIQQAEQLMKSNNWMDVADAEEIYRILGMKKEENEAHGISRSMYHSEEYYSGLS